MLVGRSINKPILLVVVWLLALFSYKSTEAQDIKKRFIDAEYYFLFEDFDKALPLYLSILNDDPENANVAYRIGLSYMHLPNPQEKDKALPYLEKASKNINPKYKESSYKERGAPKEVLFYLGNSYRYKHDFDKAINAYVQFRDLLDVKDVYYIDYMNREIQSTENARELVRLPVKIETEKLSGAINNPATVENCPVINDDETVLVFTSGKNNIFSPDIDLSVINQDYELDNIYFSLKKEGRWTESRNITKEIGATRRAVPVTISADGTELYLVQDDNDNGNIYVSKYKNDRWTEMKPLNKNINTKDWESHATLTRDGKTLYFTSDRPGGYGGLDIYRADLDASGDWGIPVNLGPVINTPYDEETPFILDDGKTLYFSSQGHYGMGGFDVFHSMLLGNNQWSTPLNLGYPINTVGNDLFYVPKANGEYAFFPLNNNERGIGTNDIFKIKVPAPGTENPEIYLKGTITLQDKKNELPHDFVIAVIDSVSGDTTVKNIPDLITGDYLAQINSGNFKIEYRCKGYKTHYEYLFIPQIFTRTEIVIDVEMIPTEVSSGEYYVIRNIFFDYGKADLRRESQVELERLASLMMQNPTLYIEIVGHTDALGSTEFNKKLSERRARSAIDYLVHLGVPEDRFVAKGMGESEFIAINENPDGSDNPEGRQLNRRVEVKILNSDAENIIVEAISVPDNLKFYKDGRQRSDERYTIMLAKQSTKLGVTGNIQAKEYFVNNEYVYTTGDFKNKGEAVQSLNQCIDEGFTDASIISASELNTLIAGLTTKQNVSDGLQNSDTTVFSIQIKALTKPAASNYFANLKGVKEHFCEDGFYRYTYGEFKTIEKAREAQKDVIDKGYVDAFVVNLARFNRKVEVHGEFTIQVSSLKKPVNLTSFIGLKNVRELIGNDGQFKYLYGNYKSIDDARKDLKKIQKAGYPDAFVISMEKFR